MIVSLSGVIVQKSDRAVVIENGGIGYRIFMHSTALVNLPAAGTNVKLYTYLYVRENQTMELYGTRTQEELDVFELLLTVSGIGPKGALAVLSVAKLDDLKQAIVSGDHTLLTRVSGIGRKTAQKIILELREKIAASVEHIDMSIAGAAADALEALVKLGYSQREAREALRQASKDAKTIEEKVKAALKILGQRT